MRAIARCLAWLRSLDELSGLDSPLRRLHPASIVLVTFLYLFTAVSYGRYEITAPLALALYPCLLVALSGVPLRTIAVPLLLAEPFILAIGLLNPFLDTQPVLVAGHPVARGWLVLFSLTVKGTLAVSGALLLAVTLGMERLAFGLRRLGLPGGLVLQLVLTYRYLWVLLEEAGRMLLAYALRSKSGGGVRPRHWGPLAGGLLVRSYARAERIHQGMLLRGFDGEFRTGRIAGPGRLDAVYVAAWLAFFALARFHNLPAALGGFFERA